MSRYGNDKGLQDRMKRALREAKRLQDELYETVSELKNKQLALDLAARKNKELVKERDKILAHSQEVEDAYSEYVLANPSQELREEMKEVYSLAVQ